MRIFLSGFLALIGSGASAAASVESKVDALFAAFQRSDSAGCSVGVMRNGVLAYHRSFGEASVELGVPLSDQSVFYIASVSKQFTAASVLLAAEKGLLSLDDGIRKHVPELPEYAQPVTLRHLMHHTSGFRDVWDLVERSGADLGDAHSAKELLDRIRREPALNFMPGAKSQYSNTNYFLLAEVVRRATGTSLAQFAEENIFRPLGMTRTRFYDDRRVVVQGRVAAYGATAEGVVEVNWSTRFDSVGPGGVMSTVADLARWDRNFYDNRLGKGSLVSGLESPGTLADGRRVSGVLGGTDTYHGQRIFEQAGSLFGYRADMLRFPDIRLTIVCLCNTSAADPVMLARGVADLYLARLVGASPARQSAEP